ncbi:flagellar hook protein FlgE [Rhodoferax sp. PAMC 29310]|uniref:flagellar hook protein FlgE n=1 Tax=Rhodoferax sp. PAMC 29310 TaxID=2822760 RepID=UPI001B33FB18|nr:flagellar hook protein FlgE [Rhodoferax sp. PAMC 29310]
MSSQSGLSGLNAAARSLDVIGNNIANASTTGMKSSRTEFHDLVATSSSGNSSTSAGIGTGVAAVSQAFTQGSLNITGRDLDVAINGGGFFQLTMPNGTTAFTRDGTFKLDTNGFVVTNAGANVMGYPTSATGTSTSTIIQPLQLPTAAAIPAKQTAQVSASANLNAAAPLAVGSPAVLAVPASVGPPPTPATPGVAAVPATPIATFGTSLTAYDAQGVPAPVNVFFSKVAPATAATDQWDVYDTAASGATRIGYVVFDTSGSLVGAYDNSGTVTATPMTLTMTVTPSSTSIVPPFPVALDLTKVTQYGAAFSVSSLAQDGYPPGELTGMKVGDDGVITARYSNGQTQSTGKIVLADFRNLHGLSPVGGGNWVETSASGQPIQGSPGVGKFGILRSGALEESNVDLTAELVNMMTAQRAYQANAQTIKTQDQMMQSIVNLR